MNQMKIDNQQIPLEQEQAANKSGGQWKQFLSMMRGAVPSKWVFIIAVILSVVEAAGGLIVPIFTRDLIDQFAGAGIDTGVIIWLITAFILQAAAGGFSYYMMTYIGETFVRKIRTRLWNHVLKLRIPYFDRHESGELISRVTQDTNTVKTLVTNHLVTSVSGIISIFGAIIILVVIDWKMTLIMLSAVPISMLILFPIGRLVYKISLKTQDELASFSASLGRVLSDIRLVKSHNAQTLESQNGERKIGNLFNLGLKEAKIQAIVSPLMTTVILALLVVLIGYGGARVASGDLSAGTLVAIIIYMFQIIMPFSLLAQFFTAFQKAMGATERIQELMQTDTEPEQSAEPSMSSERKNVYAGGQTVSSESALHSTQNLAMSDNLDLGTHMKAKSDTGNAQQTSSLATLIDWRQPIHFEGVSFSYGEEQVLQDLNFTIEPGSTVAFVGPSGAGKTTIFSLLERFYETTEGAIQLGDDDIDHLSLFSWREGIGYVPQESPIMSGTVKSNLIYGLSRTVNDTEIVEAARLANAAEFIEAMPDGYETEVGERGIKLSGGQRQRIAIARAFLRDPKLLLLDEATSNLDSESEALVQQALDNLMRGRTTLIIAHRLSTVIGADRIIFLERGVITGKGSHEQLMEQHELYRKFVHQQMKQKEVPTGTV